MNELELTFENMKLNGANVGGLYYDEVSGNPYYKMLDIILKEEYAKVYTKTLYGYMAPDHSYSHELCDYYYDVILKLKRNEYREIENDEIIFTFGFTTDEMQKIARDTGKKVFGVATR